MEEKKKTIPEQFGQIALGFAEIIGKIDGKKAEKLPDKGVKRK